MLNLAEHARNLTDRLDRGWVKSWLQYFPFLQELNVKNIPGLSREWLVENELPTVGWRSINEEPSESTGKTERRMTSVGMMSSLVKIDYALLEDPTRNDEMQMQLGMKARAMGYELAYQIINGALTTDPETFNGLSLLATELNNRNSRQILDASGLQLVTATDIDNNGDTFLDDVHQLIQRVQSGTGQKPSFLLMSENMYLKMRSIVRRLGYLETTQDSFDRRVDMFDGVKMYQVGFRVSGTTSTEILGDNFDGNGYTSIFAVATGDGYTSLIQQGALRKKHLGPDGNSGTWDIWRFDHHVGLQVEDNFSIGRLKGLDITA